MTMGAMIKATEVPSGPPTMVGSLFFRGQKLVWDNDKGLFDARAARALLRREEDVAKACGLPRVIDVIGDTAEALRRHLEFVAENCDDLMMLDSADRSARIQVVRQLKGSPLADRLIYNSIDERVSREELDVVQDSGLRRAVVLALGSTVIRPSERLKLLTGGADDSQGGLIARLQSRGVDDVWVDAGVLDLPSIGWSALTLARAREMFRVRVGCAPCNAVYLWIRDRRPPPKVLAAVTAAAFSLPLAWGADFVFYGSPANAPWVYPAVQELQGMLAYAAREAARERDQRG
ncbi:MAG TPA: tetrahydromethanopterin S-methyltransferase subunit H [Bacillota bacterium]|jgi:tetrahydromethanopterin S-methyltransferase subunit H